MKIMRVSGVAVRTAGAVRPTHLNGNLITVVKALTRDFNGLVRTTKGRLGMLLPQHQVSLADFRQGNGRTSWFAQKQTKA